MIDIESFINYKNMNIAGYVKEKEKILINGIYVRVLMPFNVYLQNGVFLDEIIDEENVEYNRIDPKQFVDYLRVRNYIRILSSADAEILGGVDLDIANYTINCFTPGAADINYVMIRLSEHLDLYSIQDVALLATYRSSVVKNMNIRQILSNRDNYSARKAIPVLLELNHTLLK